MCYLKSVITNENGEMEINQAQAKLLKKLKNAINLMLQIAMKIIKMQLR